MGADRPRFVPAEGLISRNRPSVQVRGPTPRTTLQAPHFGAMMNCAATSPCQAGGKPALADCARFCRIPEAPPTSSLNVLRKWPPPDGPRNRAGRECIFTRAVAGAVDASARTAPIAPAGGVSRRRGCVCPHRGAGDQQLLTDPRRGPPTLLANDQDRSADARWRRRYEHQAGRERAAQIGCRAGS